MASGGYMKHGDRSEFFYEWKTFSNIEILFQLSLNMRGLQFPAGLLDP